MFKHRNPFGVWLLGGLTLGIYYLVLFDRMNAELSAALGTARTADGRWWSQIIPVYGIVAVHRTAQRINDVARVKLVSPTASWLFWSWFFVGPYAYMVSGMNKVRAVAVA